MATPKVDPSAELPEEQLVTERRRAPRFPSDLQTSCRPLTTRDGTSWPARVRDISRGGVALILRRRFEPGAVLTMELEDPAGAVSRSVFARVIHVRPDEAGTWMLGCAFTGELSDDELRAFRAERSRPEADDGRAWVRFDCDVATTCRDAADRRARPVAVRIVNIAPGGIGLLTATPYEKGTLLSLQLPAAPGSDARTALVRVAQPARPVDGQWLLGCEFADRLGDDDLRGLLR
jgi:hypothetical protein